MEHRVNIFAEIVSVIITIPLAIILCIILLIYYLCLFIQFGWNEYVRKVGEVDNIS